MKDLSKISVVLPSLDPDEKLIAVVDGLLEYGFSDIILVNDGSKQENLHYFTDLAAQHPEIHLLHHEVNKGKGAALKNAFRWFLTNRPEGFGVVTVDGDNQHHPADTRTCCEHMLETGHAVLGCRDFNQEDVPARSSFGNNCSVINEESGGIDGIYHTWDREPPITFDAFIGIDLWLDGTGRLQQENDGLNFLLSFLQTLWTPGGGWNADSGNILKQIIRDFCLSRKEKHERPVFDDLRGFVVSEIAPQIHSEGGYRCGDVIVTEQRFDIDGLILSMGDYSTGGPFGFLLNDRNPRDLFSSRFTSSFPFINILPSWKSSSGSMPFF